jgi:hypothetical protein
LPASRVIRSICKPNVADGGSRLAVRTSRGSVRVVATYASTTSGAGTSSR